jgi:transcriptional regulator with GAF, ATPase, and Fis domain
LELKRKIGKVSKVDFSLLITGESGSGKELVARAVHLLSRKESGKFVPVNAASIPENLIESELFGYARGAFTDAKTDKAGLVEEADEGTLFLDEIGELPLHLQAKLLRVIQENEIKRLGENRTRRVNVRFIFASNRDLKSMINEGKFRVDLFYRIQDLVINVPPLRERVEDIPLLTRYFFKKFSFKTNDKKFMEKIIKKFEIREWKGNVRELESAVKRIITFFPDYDSSFPGVRSIENNHGLINKRMLFEKNIISETLKKNRWNKTKSAKELKISRTYLFDLINRYNISKKEIG